MSVCGITQHYQPYMQVESTARAAWPPRTPITFECGQPSAERGTILPGGTAPLIGVFMVGEIRVIPVRGIGEVRPGEDLAATILDALAGGGLSLGDGDVLIVTQKIVSKAEGRIV